MSGRILIAGTGSGCGKTTVTSGLLQCLVNRGLAPAAFKCGPDYIDPMFYRRITGCRAGNLDPYFCDRSLLRRLAEQESRGADVSVIEGVMGYYDGIGFSSEASTFSVACALEAPVVLVLGCRGMGASAGAVLRGFLDWPEIAHSRIRGVIFSQLPGRLYPAAAETARSMGVMPLGYLPRDPSLGLESRHLGLVTPDEIVDLKEKMNTLAAAVERYIDVDAILALAASAPALREEEGASLPPGQAEAADGGAFGSENQEAPQVRVAVAMDDAFCFTYRENLQCLEELGCTLVPFSPLADPALPAGCCGLLLSGGYPELHAAALSENHAMRQSVYEACRRGMPVIAECGGFLYLHRELEGTDGRFYPMAGVLDRRCVRTGSLRRFGYVQLTAQKGGMLCPEGSSMKAHEFHYWDSEDCGGDFLAEKPDGSRQWACGIHTQTMYAGFPHLFFYEAKEAAAGFVRACRKYAAAEKESEKEYGEQGRNASAADPADSSKG